MAMALPVAQQFHSRRAARSGEADLEIYACVAVRVVGLQTYSGQ